MPIALSVLLEGFGNFTKQLYIPKSQFAGTADTDGTTAALKDTELNVFADNFFNDYYWVYIVSGGTGGGGAGNIRKISDFTQVGGIVVPEIVFSGIPKIGATYQIWKCHVQDVIDAINDAIDSLYTNQRLYRKIVFEGLGTSLLGADAASAQADVTVVDATLFFAGQILTIEDDNSSETCTILSINTTTNVLTMTANLTNAYATADNAKVTAQSGKYFSLGATLGNARITGVFLKLDETTRRSRYTAWGVITNDDGVRQFYFPTSISMDDKTWVIEAIAKLEEVEDPTDTITLEDERVKLLYAEAAYHLYLKQSNDISAGDYQQLIALAGRYRQQTLTDFRALQMAKPVEVADMDIYD